MMMMMMMGRGRRLSTLFSLLGVYANAEQVLLAYTPSQSRAQREDVLAAIAAKEAEVASSQEQPEGQLRQAQPSKAGKARSPDSELKSDPKAKIRPDLRGEMSGADGKNPNLVFSMQSLEALRHVWPPLYYIS